MSCNKLKFPGKDVVLEYHIGCPEDLPLETDWKRFGSLRTKEFEISWDTADGTDSDSVGSLRENIATFQTMSISGDGTVKASGAGADNLITLTKHVIKPDATGGQPAIWLRMTYPDLTFIAYCLVSNISRSAPYDDITTYSFEASATSSDYGLIVEDTPKADAPEPESVQVVPDAVSIDIGKTYDFQAAVLPAGAPQSLRWTSSAPSVATVDAVTGLVTGISAGTVTITAASAIDPDVDSTATLTVIPLVAGINVSPTSVVVVEGDTEQLTASVAPVGASSGLLYESANPAVATVSNAGLVTGIAAGSTNVVVRSAARPAVSVTIPVEVTAP